MPSASRRRRVASFCAAFTLVVSAAAPANGGENEAITDVPNGMEYDGGIEALRSDLLEGDAATAAEQGFDYGLTLSRLEAQPVLELAAAEFYAHDAATFAGFRWGAGTNLIAQFKGTASQNAIAVLDATDLEYELEPVARSSVDLDQLMDNMRNEFESYDPADVSIAIDPITQGVLVSVATTEADEGMTSAELADDISSRVGADVAVDYVDGPVFTPTNGYGGAELWHDISFQCTTGFTVFTGLGTTGLAAADHCADQLPATGSYYQNSNTSPNTYHDIVFKAGSFGAWGDVAWWTTDGIEYDDFYHGPGGVFLRDVSGMKTSFAVSDPVTSYGHTTNGDTAATLGWLSVSSGGLSRLTCTTSALYQPGDSGGPVFSGSVAVGFITGNVLINGTKRPCFTRAMYMDDALGSVYIKAT